jgi:hypothetical protein
MSNEKAVKHGAIVVFKNYICIWHKKEHSPINEINFFLACNRALQHLQSQNISKTTKPKFQWTGKLEVWPLLWECPLSRYLQKEFFFKKKKDIHIASDGM